MSFVEWGREFPVSSMNIPKLFDSIVHSFRPVRSVIRSLTVIVFLFEDSSVLAIPVSFLQQAQNVQALQAFVNNSDSQPPSGIVFVENSTKVVDLVSASESFPVFFVFKEDFTYDIISFGNDGVLQLHQGEPMTLGAGQIKKVVVQNSIISVVCENEGKLSVFSAKLKISDPIGGWALQCDIDELSEIVNQPPCLYVLKSDGVYGCALDDKGLRRFARPLVEVSLGKFIRVSSFTGFYVFDIETLEISRISGKTKTLVCKLAIDHKQIQRVIAIGNRIFVLSSHSIETFDFLSGELVSSFDTPETDHWILSVESSYGAVFIGTKCYTLSRTEIGPLFNLYADESELIEQMRSVKQSVGTVAAPILMLANRSPYLAAKLMAEEIANECEKPPIPGTLQEKVRPMLMTLNDLLLHKPE